MALDPEVDPNRSRHDRRVATGLLGLVLCLTIVGGAAGRVPILLSRIVGRTLLVIHGGAFLGTSGVVMQRRSYDCGPAALASLAQLLGVALPDLDSLMVLTRTTVRGTSLAALRRASAVLGLELEARHIVARRLDRVELPVIAWIRRNHFVVVETATKTETEVLDPLLGRYRVPTSRFTGWWSGDVLQPVQPAREGGLGLSSGRHPFTPLKGGRMESIRRLSLSLFVALSLAIGFLSTAPGRETARETMFGRGWGRFFAGIGCMGCVVGAGVIVSGGWTVVLGAMAHPRSLVVASACIGTCGYAIGIDELL